jgi:flagellin-like protein
MQRQAGNTMQVPVVGAVLLIAFVFTEASCDTDSPDFLSLCARASL